MSPDPLHWSGETGTAGISPPYICCFFLAAGKFTKVVDAGTKEVDDVIILFSLRVQGRLYGLLGTWVRKIACLNIFRVVTVRGADPPSPRSPRIDRGLTADKMHGIILHRCVHLAPSGI